jgi:hypothetical protein
MAARMRSAAWPTTIGWGSSSSIVPDEPEARPRALMPCGARRARDREGRCVTLTAQILSCGRGR